MHIISWRKCDKPRWCSHIRYQRPDFIAHIFFLGDFNYRLTISRNQVEQFVKNESYAQLLEYDQLKKEYKDYYGNREIIEVNNIPYGILHLKKGFYIKYVPRNVGEGGKNPFI